MLIVHALQFATQNYSTYTEFTHAYIIITVYANDRKTFHTADTFELIYLIKGRRSHLQISPISTKTSY